MLLLKGGIFIMPPGVSFDIMTYVIKILDFAYFLITNITDNEIFRYFLFMTILTFVFKTIREIVCTI